jgi:hypothetical protein
LFKEVYKGGGAERKTIQLITSSSASQLDDKIEKGLTVIWVRCEFSLGKLLKCR